MFQLPIVVSLKVLAAALQRAGLEREPRDSIAQDTSARHRFQSEPLCMFASCISCRGQRREEVGLLIKW